jgi:hypothetical protein
MSEYKPVVKDSLADLNRKNRQRFGDDFKESDHPREGGKFASKGGGGGGETKPAGFAPTKGSGGKEVSTEKFDSAQKEFSAALSVFEKQRSAYRTAERKHGASSLQAQSAKKTMVEALNKSNQLADVRNAELESLRKQGVTSIRGAAV